MEIDLIKVELAQKPILGQLLELYCHDLSTYIDIDVNEEGLYNYKYLDLYWIEPNRHAFFLKVDGQYAGFILINKDFKLINPENGFALAEFFVMRKYRRKGIGKVAAFKAFDLFSGTWEVVQLIQNEEAIQFWKAVIDEYTSGNFAVEFAEKKGIKRHIITFEN